MWKKFHQISYPQKMCTPLPLLPINLINFIYSGNMLIKDIFFKKEKTRTPLWMMRQAGRYLPEYRKIRADFPDFMNFCYTPKAACEVTLQPITRFDFDAAIIFSDILVIPDALGQKVGFKPDHGPILAEFKPFELEKNVSKGFFDYLSPVYETLSLARNKLSPEKALYGFAGSPWTLACYMVEEGKSQDFLNIKQYAKNPETAHEFMQILDLLTEAVAIHLIHQIDAGADIVQLFDSWASLVDDEDHAAFLIQPAVKIMKKVHAKHPNVPFVYYARSKSPVLLKINALCQDYRYPLGLGVHQGVDLGDVYTLSLPIQGNLCPEILLKGGEDLHSAVINIMEKMRDRLHIFNLGHGILKETPIEHVHQLVKTVRNFT